MKAILGIKKGMTQVYEGDVVVPVTIVEVSDCIVSFKNENGVELGLGKIRGNKALQGKYKSLGYVPAHRAYFSGDYNEFNLGDKVEVSKFVVNDLVKVSGEAKGKGFAGVIKRWGFAGGPKTHGQSNKWRSPGAIGAGTDPGRIWKNTKMAGRKGGNRVTLKNKRVVKVVDNCVLISGPLPGNRGDLVIISSEK